MVRTFGARGHSREIFASPASSTPTSVNVKSRGNEILTAINGTTAVTKSGVAKVDRVDAEGKHFEFHSRWEDTIVGELCSVSC